MYLLFVSTVYNYIEEINFSTVVTQYTACKVGIYLVVNNNITHTYKLGKFKRNVV